MRRLSLRHILDAVVARLEALAARRSVSAFAARELSQPSRRADNAALLATLPDLSVSRESIVADIRAERDAR